MATTATAKKTGSGFNYLMANGSPLIPEVGMGCTILHWTDRDAATIMKVSEDKKTIWISADKATPQFQGMTDSQSYTYETVNADKPETWSEYTLRKDGKYYRKGDSTRSYLPLALGYRRTYFDFSF